jgi:DNA helicase-2/ATP-dependent DNA helicase PcrA
MNLLDNLNKEQLEAVKVSEGPCLVIAGAGSGKTKVLTTRIAYLIKNGIYSSHILAITFTNKAAKEMRERLDNLIDENYSFVGTFHSFGLRVIKENYSLFNLTKNFTIIDSDDSLNIIKKLMKDLDIDPKFVSPGFIKNKISFIKNNMLNDSEIERFLCSEQESYATKVYCEYEKLLKRNNSLDFDDLLKKPVELLTNNNDILDKYQEKYQYILIDEYQDTNEVQYKLVKLMASKYRNLFVVGDANQSIYAFRYANYKNILNFEKDYPEAKVITLNQNYRSTVNILKAANDVIKNNKEKGDVELFSELGDGVKLKYLRAFDEKQEVVFVCEEIEKLLENGYKKNDIACFYRTNAQSRIIEEGMLKNNFTYKVIGSFYFYKRKEIKDLISYLRLINNHSDDESLERIINVPKRKIGPKTIENIKNNAKINNIDMYDAIVEGKELEFKKLIEDFTLKKDSLSLTELIDYILDKSGMKEELTQDKTLESDLRLDNLMEFRSITENYQNETGTINLDDFLDDLSLVADIKERESVDDAITLMTIHSAKGLEFKVVFILGLEEGLLPHSNSMSEDGGIEEERRLMYVAITRAKERLYLSNAERRMLYGETIMYPPSRFIKEISPDLIETEVKENNNKYGFVKDNLYSDKNVLYKEGEIVFHLSFGKGVVVGSDDRFVTVAFDKRWGIKKFLSNYTGLKRKDN